MPVRGQVEHPADEGISAVIGGVHRGDQWAHQLDHRGVESFRLVHERLVPGLLEPDQLLRRSGESVDIGQAGLGRNEVIPAAEEEEHRDVQDRSELEEVELVKSLGVEFRCGVEVGRDVSRAELDQFDAIFIGVGLGAMDRLGIPGDRLPGVIDALQFIARYKTQPGFQVGRRVIVIGSPCCSISLR